jgi:para-nitrobenzyl esterase
MNRRTLLRNSGMAAAALALRAKAWAWADGAPVATTTAGKISGVVEDGINTFKGVPYGGDTAKTRFQAPVAPEKWTGVKDCSAFTTMAPQLVAARAGGPRPAPSPTGNAPTSASGVPGVARDRGVQSEDCLHLNVFTPGLHDGKKRPVLCYFHGGAYNNGTVNSDLYDGKRLCQRGDVVVVTVNHRLNAFGYMYLGDLAPEYKESGNAGQLDLVLALKWVKENIAEFGGDPARVLIFGQSGGGAKCAALMATPVAKGLFHRVMTMSGQQIKGRVDRDCVGADEDGAGEDGRGRLKGKDWWRSWIADHGADPGWRAGGELGLAAGGRQRGAVSRNPFDPDAPALS